ncbi:hypothetical protein [Sphingomonas solaris]|uniref:Uncharacterized protein n=1 Tax=Alterirhizorhabdus solaris TaxID=2529389 RepID=A0A558R2J0_9SPHN|nr:hypothetical protein [Sphingomonas solaris]TVV73601.1 hypothetical protein FOY91_11965 [Sphingomonas solaris]
MQFDAIASSMSTPSPHQAGTQALRSFYVKAPAPAVRHPHRPIVTMLLAIAVSAPLLGMVAFTGY